MIFFKINELITKKESDKNCKISLQDISNDTGINRTVLSRMKNHNETYSTTTNTIDLLCEYFDCSVGEIIEFRKQQK